MTAGAAKRCSDGQDKCLTSFRALCDSFYDNGDAQARTILHAFEACVDFMRVCGWEIIRLYSFTYIHAFAHAHVFCRMQLGVCIDVRPCVNVIE